MYMVPVYILVLSNMEQFLFKLFRDTSEATNVRRCLTEVAVSWVVPHYVMCKKVDRVKVTIWHFGLNKT